MTARIDDYIVRTARNGVLPSATRSYAFDASDSRYVSTMVLTFPRYEIKSLIEIFGAVLLTANDPDPVLSKSRTR